MSNRKNMGIRKRIYEELIKGFSPAQIAEKLDMSGSHIFYHIKLLEKEGVIVRLGERKTPALYRRGPNYAVLENLEGSLNRDGLGENSTPSDFPAFVMPSHEDRADRAWFTCKIQKIADPGLVWWSKSWKWNNSIIKYRTFVLSNGRLASIEVINDKTATIKIEPFEVKSEVIDSEKIGEVATAYAMQVIRLTKYACKISLGLPEPIDGMETGHTLPHLRGIKVGKIQTSPTSHIDDSPRGRPEWETTSVSEHVTMHKLPWKIERIETLIPAIFNRLDIMDKNLEQMVAVQEKIATVLEKVLKKLSGEVEDKPVKEMDQSDRGAYR